MGATHAERAEIAFVVLLRLPACHNVSGTAERAGIGNWLRKTRKTGKSSGHGRPSAASGAERELL